MRFLLQFARLGAAKRTLGLRALGAVATVRLALCVFSLPRIQRFLSRDAARNATSATQVPAALSPTLSPTLSPSQIGGAVGAASRFVPRSTCLVQALAAQFLLQRAGFAARLQVGVNKGSAGELTAHAWVECEGAVVIGDTDLASYTPLLR